MSKSTDAEISKRVATVAQMLITGQNRQDILRYCSEKYEISERQGENYISKANVMIAELHEQDVDYYRKLILARQEDLYNRNFKIQDYRECRQVLQDIAKLLGANEPDKADVNLNLPSLQVEVVKNESK